MSGSLSAMQMLPGHRPGASPYSYTAPDDSGMMPSERRVGERAEEAALPEQAVAGPAHGIQTGALHAGGVSGWHGGDTRGGLRSGSFSTAAQNMSYAVQKGETPLPASKSSLGSLLFAMDEGLSAPASPEAAGTRFRKD